MRISSRKSIVCCIVLLLLRLHRIKISSCFPCWMGCKTLFCCYSCAHFPRYYGKNLDNSTTKTNFLAWNYHELLSTIIIVSPRHDTSWLLITWIAVNFQWIEFHSVNFFLLILITQTIVCRVWVFYLLFPCPHNACVWFVPVVVNVWSEQKFLFYLSLNKKLLSRVCKSCLYCED